MPKVPNYNISILLVDDDALVRTVLFEYLISFGFKNILLAKNVTEALKFLQDRKQTVDLILSDWEMPGEKGVDLLKMVRKNSIRKNVPFIMITSQESIERFKITRAVQWRVSDYMVKPFTSELFRDRLWNTLGWKDEDYKDEAS